MADKAAGEHAIALNSRTALLLATLFGGGVLGGGGLSFAADPSKEVAYLRQEIAALKTSVESVEDVAVEIRVELRSLRDDEDRLEERVKDHEARLRALEVERGSQ